jgi:hypothetical protein
VDTGASVSVQTRPDVAHGSHFPAGLQRRYSPDQVNARDGEKDSITCDGANNAVYYDRGLDILKGCARNGLTELSPPNGLFESGTEVLVGHAGEELCVPEKALKGHLEHGDRILNWSGCSEQP